MFNLCNHQSTVLFGFSALFTPSENSAYSKAKEGVAQFEKSTADNFSKWLAVANLVGAVPVIGGIPVGLGRIIVAIIRYQEDKSGGHALIGRGLVEIAGGGPLLFLIDVFFTLGRLLPRAPEGDTV